MAFEDFDTYTEVDPNSHLTPNGVKIDWIGVTRNEDVYCYDDKGVDHFDGDFSHLSEVYVNSASDAGSNALPWMLSNEIDDEKGLRDAGKSYLTMLVVGQATDWALYLREVDSGTTYQDPNLSLSFNTPYYLRTVRDEAVGTYGTIYCYVYTDSARTTLLDTLTVSLHTSKKDFRYYWGFNSLNSGIVSAATGYTQNHDLQEAVAGAPSMLSLLGVGHA